MQRCSRRSVSGDPRSIPSPGSSRGAVTREHNKAYALHPIPAAPRRAVGTTNIFGDTPMNRLLSGAWACVPMATPLLPLASSHREAPLVAGEPREDGTDVYAFRSYEPGLAAFVILIANSIPFQSPTA